MKVVNVAARYTQVPGGTSLQSIASSETIIVHGAVFACTSTDSVTFFESDGTTAILTLTLPSNLSFELKTSFIAQRGLKVTTGTNMTCTVFHSQGAA